MVSRTLIFLITLYQKTVSPDHGMLHPLFPSGVCRFHPTCSEYTKEALAEHGVVKGGLLAVRRVVRCHPFASGGFDPVPERKR
jgi:putative membrane protein insertion efficiency factor